MSQRNLNVQFGDESSQISGSNGAVMGVPGRRGIARFKRQRSNRRRRRRRGGGDRHSNRPSARPVGPDKAHEKATWRSFYYLKLCSRTLTALPYSSSPFCHFIFCLLRSEAETEAERDGLCACYWHLRGVAWLEIIRGGRACQPPSTRSLARSPQSSIS